MLSGVTDSFLFMVVAVAFICILRILYLNRTLATPHKNKAYEVVQQDLLDIKSTSDCGITRSMFRLTRLISRYA